MREPSPKTLIENGFQSVTSELGPLEPDSAVAVSVRAHCEHLKALADNLRAVGMDDKEIDEHVVALFERYKAKLTEVIAKL